MFQGLSGVLKGIECIKKYNGSSNISMSKGYQKVSNVYKCIKEYHVYQRILGISNVSNVH